MLRRINLSNVSRAHGSTVARACFRPILRVLPTFLLVGGLVATYPASGWGGEDAAGAESGIQARAQEAGLGELKRLASPRYIVLGDSEPAFLEDVSRLCESLAEDFHAHFQKRGFTLVEPTEPLAVVALKSPESFAAFLGVKPDAVVGGQYDPVSNRLVVFDNRGRENASPLSARANTIALMHEATHQLTFNNGLLDPAGDIPLAISEGLATYGETRRPDGSKGVGAANPERGAAFAQALRTGRGWIPLERLIVDDELFHNPDTQQLAYAEAWLLARELVEKGEPLRVYLDRIRSRRDAKARLEDARATLGDLDALDQSLGRKATRMGRGG